MSIVKKKKHVSKKNKKAWRKHCDIRDVEDFLEDQRLDERLGKFETKPDSEIFVIDTGIVEAKPTAEDAEKPLTAKQRRRAQFSQIPKCFEILQPSSKVQDPNAKRNHVNPVGTKPTALSKLTEKRKAKKGAYEKKLELAKKNRKIALDKKRKVKKNRLDFTKDVWGGDAFDAKGIPSTLVDDFISPEAQIHNVLTEQRMRTKPPLAKTVVTRAAVEPPHPGVSYNPTYQEHQELLQQVVQHEEKMMKKEAHLNRVTTGMFSKLTSSQMEDQWRTEMSVGLPKPDDPKEGNDSGSETDNEYKAVNPPVKNKKKDHKARRKQKEQQVEKERLKQAKINKKKISDLYLLRKLQAKISAKEAREAKEREERHVKRETKAAEALPTLSAHKTPIKEPDFVEPSALSGDLRHISSTTNLLRERYESLQRRGKLAAAKLMMKKKRKLKSYFKPGHKVTDQEVEKYMAKMDGNGPLKGRA